MKRRLRAHHGHIDKGNSPFRKRPRRTKWSLVESVESGGMLVSRDPVARASPRTSNSVERAPKLSAGLITWQGSRRNVLFGY